jgi:hypothetical protein
VRWVRTWPADIPAGRSYVVDDLKRIVMDSYNYVPVLEQLDGDTVIIEWDLAVSFEDKGRFTALREPVWAHRMPHRLPPWITEADQECIWFSFGLVYLPHMIVTRYLATGPEVTGDALFSQWHHAQGLSPVPVHWNVRPVHLHY